MIRSSELVTKRLFPPDPLWPATAVKHLTGVGHNPGDVQPTNPVVSRVGPPSQFPTLTPIEIVIHHFQFFLGDAGESATPPSPIDDGRDAIAVLGDRGGGQCGDEPRGQQPLMVQVHTRLHATAASTSTSTRFASICCIKF